MVVMIAREIAQYLQNMGEGTLNVDLFVDVQPDAPDNVISIYDKGGLAHQDPPESWRELYIQVRDSSHQNGYDRIWRVLNFILMPATTYIEVGVNKYVARLKEIPATLNQDVQNRYLFGCRVVVCGVKGVLSADDLLDALADWSGTVLTGWTVYKVWPGNKRPSVTWRMSNVQVVEKAKAVYEVRKKYVGSILGGSPDELVFGAMKILQELKNSVKLTQDAANQRYLTVIDPVADLRDDAYTAGQVSLVLSRVTNRPFEDAPLMSAVNYKNIIK